MESVKITLHKRKRPRYKPNFTSSAYRLTYNEQGTTNEYTVMFCAYYSRVNTKA